MVVGEAFAFHLEEDQISSIFQSSDGRIGNHTPIYTEWWKQFKLVHPCEYIKHSFKFKPYLKKKRGNVKNKYICKCRSKVLKISAYVVWQLQVERNHDMRPFSFLFNMAALPYNMQNCIFFLYKCGSITHLWQHHFF